MKPEWRTDTKPIDLSDEDHSHFQAYCEWLYTKKIFAKVHGDDDNHLHFGHLYVLGAKLMDRSFQQNVLRALVDNIHVIDRYPSRKTVKFIYEGTTQGDPARHLLLDIWVSKAHSGWDGIKDDEQITAVTNLSFVNDLVRARVSRRPRPSGALPWVQGLESYLTDFVEV
jgi:hypothetical protein